MSYSRVEAAHSALCASIYRFSNDGPKFEDKVVDPQNWPN